MLQFAQEAMRQITKKDDELKPKIAVWHDVHIRRKLINLLNERLETVAIATFMTPHEKIKFLAH